MIGSVARRGRWHEFLSQFNLEIVYVPGKNHKVSDALSRWAYPACTVTQERTFHGDSKAQKVADYMDELEHQLDFGVARGVTVAAVATKGVFQSAWSYSSTCWKELYQDLKKNKPHDGCYLSGDKLFKTGKLCVPKDKTVPVVEYYHAYGHPSGYKLLDIMLHRIPV